MKALLRYSVIGILLALLLVSCATTKTPNSNKNNNTISEKRLYDKKYNVAEYIEKQKLSNKLNPKDSLYSEAYELYSKAENLDPFLFTLVGTKKKECIEFLEKAIEINPNYHAANYILAISYAQIGNFKKSEAYYRKSIELKPLYLNGYVNIADLYFANNDLQNSLNYYQKTLKLDPDNGQAYNGMGKVYYDLNNFRKSEESFKKTVELKDEYSVDLALLGLTLISLEQNDLESSWEYMVRIDYLKDQKYEDRIRYLCKPYLDNNNFYAYAIDGHLDYLRNNYPETIKKLSKAKKLNIKKFVQYLELGHSYLNEGYHKTALENILIAENIPRNNDAAIHLLGYIYGREDVYSAKENQQVSHDLNKAIAYFVKYTNIHPNHYISRYNLAHCLYDNGQYYQALNEVNKAIEISKTDEAYQLKGDIYFGMKEFSEAIESYELAIAKKDSVYLRIQIAGSYKEQGDLNKAISYLKHILAEERFKDYEFGEYYIRYYLAEIYKENNNFQEASVLYAKYLRKYPNSTSTKFSLGYCSLALDQFNESIKWYKQVVEVENDNSDALHNIGLSYINLGNYNEGLVWFKKAYKINNDEDTKYFIDYCNYQIGLSHYPEYLSKASNRNDDIGVIAKLVLLVNEYNKANDLWIQGQKETEYKDGENIVSSKIFEAKAVFEITLKDLNKISTKNSELKNIINKFENALIERIDGTEINAKGFYIKRKDYQGEYEKGRAKIKIADSYMVQALERMEKVLPNYETNYTKYALSNIDKSIKYYKGE